jgi:hypothetical protein
MPLNLGDDPGDDAPQRPTTLIVMGHRGADRLARYRLEPAEE